MDTNLTDFPLYLRGKTENMKHLWVILFFLMVSLRHSAQTPEQIDSLKREIPKAQSLDEKVKLHNLIAQAMLYVDLNEGVRYATDGLKVAKESGKANLMAQSYNTLGVMYINTGDNDKALAYLDSSATAYLSIGKESGASLAYGNMGTLYYLTGQYNLALKYQYKCLRFNESQKDTAAIALTLTNIIGINFVQEDFQKALENARKAYQYFRLMKDDQGVSLVATSLGSVFIELNELDSADKYINEAIRLAEPMHNDDAIADAYLFKAGLNLKRGEYELAEKNNRYALDLYNKIGQSMKRVEALKDLVNLYRSWKKWDQCLAIGDSTVSAADMVGARVQKRDALLWMMEAAREKGDYKRALMYAETYIPLRDSLLNESKQRELSELETAYQTEKKEQENLVLKSQNDLQALEISRKEIFIFGLILVLIIILVGSVIFVRQNKRLAEQKTALLEQRLLRSQMNPHFIFNSLIAIQSYIYKSEPREAGKYLSSFAKLIRAILDNSRDEVISLQKEQERLQHYLQLQSLRFDHTFDYEINMPEELELDSISIPPMLTQPFIENAIEHGLKGLEHRGKVSVNFLVEKENTSEASLKVVVKDNGKGFDFSQEKKNDDHVSLATSITKDRLQLLNRKRQQKIQFNISSEIDKGTTVTFSIPLETF